MPISHVEQQGDAAIPVYYQSLAWSGGAKYVSPGHFGQPSPPSNFELIDARNLVGSEGNLVQGQCGIPSIVCKSVQGNDWANLATRKLIRFYTEIPEDGVIR
ncbi:hypothetical protein B0H13DRAFT_1855594 [Mycena leptocephala]|nr:hypothetical protein B0H13DRAFT_1855594 [Mycena leptocephala]